MQNGEYEDYGGEEPRDSEFGEEEEGETVARFPGPDEQHARGVFLGAQWTLDFEDGVPNLVVNGRRVHLEQDSLGTFKTHHANGRWSDLRALATALIRYHPDFSPLARGEGPLVS